MPACRYTRLGNVTIVKFWLHALAALVGLMIAALIVYLVFGSASEQGAVQDGDAGSLAATSDGLCGTIAAGALTSAETRALAAENPPAMADAKGPIAAIRDDKPEQKDWFARVHAAGGLCIDEIQVTAEGTSISMSVVESVTDDQAAAYAATILAQAFTAPFHPRVVTITALVGDGERTIVVSNRAWRAYQLRRRQLGIQHSITSLKQFRAAVGRQFGAGLRITGW